MRIAIPLLALLLAGCGGAIASETPSEDPCIKAFCEAGGPHAHGALYCDGGLVYTCCSNTPAEIAHLIEVGEQAAAQCLRQ